MVEDETPHGAQPAHQGEDDAAGAAAAAAASHDGRLRGAVLGVVIAGVLAAVAVALAEWVILVVQARDRFAGVPQIAFFLPLGFGNLLPYTCLAALALALADAASRLARRRLRWSTLAVGLVFGLASLPWAIVLGRFVFSGPQARAMAGRPALVVGVTALVAATFVFAVAFSIHRSTARRGRVYVIAALAVGAAALTWISRSMFQQEYGLVHVHLGIWAILLAVLAGRELSSGLAVRVGPRTIAIAAAATLGWGIASSVVLARDEGYAWLVWQETGASRYLTRRLTFLTPTRRYQGGGAPMEVRPRLENDATVAARKRRAREQAPNIVIFSIDGLRKDHVGAYGYTKHPTTPNIDRFAARGVVFDNAFSSYPATQVFNSSLLLGRSLGLYDGEQQPPGFRDEAITRLIERRAYHSFVKSWFEHSSRSSFDGKKFAIDTYVPKAKRRREMEAPVEEIAARLAAHVAEADERGEPVFAWFHVLSTHVVGGKFKPHPDFPFGDARMDQYDSAIAGADLWLQHIEKVMSDRRDRSRSTIWILCSDHGANSDRASRDLYDGVARVPLVVVAPGIAPRREAALVDASLDLAATVVDLAGIAPPDAYDGISLVPILDGTAAPDATAHRIVPLAYLELSGAVYRSTKYVRNAASYTLFDLAADPAERRNLAGTQSDLLDQMVTVAEAESARRERAAREAGGEAGQKARGRKKKAPGDGARAAKKKKRRSDEEEPPDVE